MTILNFTVDFAKAKILSGEKQRTMRPVRENPNSVWNRLYEKWQNRTIPLLKEKNPRFPLQIWWQQRSRKWECPICGHKFIPNKEEMAYYKCVRCLQPMAKPEAHKLCDAVLTNITKKRLGDLTEEEWKADGFEPEDTFYTARDVGLEWFAHTYNTKSLDEVKNFWVYIIEFKRVE